jgi:hypothetical protein
MKQMTRSAHLAWLFTLRVLGMTGGIATIMVGLSAYQHGNPGKCLHFWLPSAWTEGNPAGRRKYHSVN